MEEGSDIDLLMKLQNPPLMDGSGDADSQQNGSTVEEASTEGQEAPAEQQESSAAGGLAALQGYSDESNQSEEQEAAPQQVTEEESSSQPSLPIVEPISDASQDGMDGQQQEEPMELEASEPEVDVNAVIRDLGELNEIAGASLPQLNDNVMETEPAPPPTMPQFEPVSDDSQGAGENLLESMQAEQQQEEGLLDAQEESLEAEPEAQEMAAEDEASEGPEAQEMAAEDEAPEEPEAPAEDQPEENLDDLQDESGVPAVAADEDEDGVALLDEQSTDEQETSTVEQPEAQEDAEVDEPDAPVEPTEADDEAAEPGEPDDTTEDTEPKDGEQATEMTEPAKKKKVPTATLR